MSNAATFLYFAYGSNMLGQRMRLRASTARRVGTATLADFELRWHKVSKDGSGKCDVVAAPGAVVHGVVYEIAMAEKPALDVAEGLGTGYREVKLEVHTASGPLLTTSYQATNIDSFTRPYDWYKALVVAGARENGLDEAYVQALEAVPVTEDWDAGRAAENRQALDTA